ncbi:hypothetical protein B0A48_17378 [Cryoendolithus antarcticus]|uniref:Polarized growth protein Boi2 n=1 Tax=Cryoendolithus antarcticus TaxID=1507870 RepID=A0A1V8SC98_9PEZI|nr:hypothetical protein B0A48_17378 [Cryoendolithus antarcticus]
MAGLIAAMMSTGVKVEAKPGSILLVVHDFVARSADELSLAKGDRIELIERDDDFGDGWFLGRHLINGNTGLFPEVYTTPAPKGTLTNGRSLSSDSTATIGTPYDATSPAKPPQQISPVTSKPPQIQQRPASASASSPSTTSPMSQIHPSLRTSLPNDPSSYASMQSPVMNETLSVINEHIVDMNTPRTSYSNAPNNRDTMASMGSVYSNQPLNRMSYVPGHETDEEDMHLHSEAEVMSWSPERVAEYLEDNGVERSHCDVFREQEISGDVLLAMEQSSVFMKEFDLGPVGRRLRTWHKIKSLQDETQMSAASQSGGPKSVSEYSVGGAPVDDTANAGANDLGRTRSTSAASALPRGLATGRQSMVEPYQRSSTMQSYTQPQSAITSSAISPLQSMTSFSRPENTYRPSAHNIRTMNHTKRHSSVGSIESTIANSVTSARTGHRKQPSMDSKWQPPSAPTNGGTANHNHTASSSSAHPLSSLQTNPATSSPSSPGDLDKGYFSSNELENRNKPAKPNVLQKKSLSTAGTPSESRTNSMLQQPASTAYTPVQPSESSRETVSPVVSTRFSAATTAVASKFGSLRTLSTPALENKAMTAQEETPVVTKLEYNTPSTLNAIASSPTTTSGASDTSSIKPTRSPTVPQLPFFITKSKVKALRATSERVTPDEKIAVTPSPTSIPSPVKEAAQDSPGGRTGSTTPSTEARSFDMGKSNTRTSSGSGSLMPPPASTRSRPQRKAKKETSAYTRGLLKVPPAEQMKDCDYSGWMKKKSGSLMTTWKPRLFVLKGRRLSYYYSEHDTEEKGLIDISFHNVLAAQNEKLTGLHATVTGAAGSPSSPTGAHTPTNAEQDLKDHPVPTSENGDGIFIFKLTPPKQGRGVTFTKPTVHYFAVNSRQEGRLWMAALMKAVVDRDQDGVVTTTYNQKTISLARARARKERPPALQEEGMTALPQQDIAELDGGDDSRSSVVINEKSGLGIEGLNGDAMTGAEKSSLPLGMEDSTVSSTPDESRSVAPSSIFTASDLDSAILTEQEREAIAMHAPS